MHLRVIDDASGLAAAHQFVGALRRKLIRKVPPVIQELSQRIFHHVLALEITDVVRDELPHGQFQFFGIYALSPGQGCAYLFLKAAQIRLRRFGLPDSGGIYRRLLRRDIPGDARSDYRPRESGSGSGGVESGNGGPQPFVNERSSHDAAGVQLHRYKVLSYIKIPLLKPLLCDGIFVRHLPLIHLQGIFGHVP